MSEYDYSAIPRTLVPSYISSYNPLSEFLWYNRPDGLGTTCGDFYHSYQVPGTK